MGNTLSRILPQIEVLTENQVDEVINAFNSNSELQGSFGFNGAKTIPWGSGLLAHLYRWSDRGFSMSSGFPKQIVLDFD